MIKIYKTENEIKNLLHIVSKSLFEQLNHLDSYQTKKIIVVPIMNASMFFATDLCREMYLNGIHFEISSLNITSYKGLYNSKPVVLMDHNDFNEQKIADSIVILLDTVADTGQTLQIAKAHLSGFYPHEMISCCLFKRHSCKEPVDCIGDFIYSDEFLIGYGLDYNGKYRELPYIGKITKGEI
jgi:hypoxanthine phosphoribosyltransferase